MGFEEEGRSAQRGVFAPYQVQRRTDVARRAPMPFSCTVFRPTAAWKSLQKFSTAPRSVVLDQSENRMYVQKAILHTLF